MEEDYTIEMHSRPKGVIRDEIVSIAQELTTEWFTSNVPDDTFRDLLFQDVLILRKATIDVKKKN